MRELPLLGPPLDDWMTFICGYSAIPGEPVCGRDATWHGFVLDDPAQRIVAMMESCGGHAGQMRLTADYVHPLRHPCCIPGSRFRWPENECYTDWSEQAEFGQAAHGKLVNA